MTHNQYLWRSGRAYGFDEGRAKSKAEIARLRKALEFYAKSTDAYPCTDGGRKARTALEPK